MKVVFVSERHGQTRTIVLKGWLKGLLSVCLLGAPVALGYLGFQLSVAHDGQSYALEVQHGQMVQRDLDADPQPDDVFVANGLYLKFHPAFPFASSDIELLARQDEARARLTGAPFYRLDQQPPRYSHGRLVDPATYSHRTAG